MPHRIHGHMMPLNCSRIQRWNPSTCLHCQQFMDISVHRVPPISFACFVEVIAGSVGHESKHLECQWWGQTNVPRRPYMRSNKCVILSGPSNRYHHLPLLLKSTCLLPSFCFGFDERTRRCHARLRYLQLVGLSRVSSSLASDLILPRHHQIISLTLTRKWNEDLRVTLVLVISTITYSATNILAHSHSHLQKNEVTQKENERGSQQQHGEFDTFASSSTPGLSTREACRQWSWCIEPGGCCEADDADEGIGVLLALFELLRHLCHVDTYKLRIDYYLMYLSYCI